MPSSTPSMGLVTEVTMKATLALLASLALFECNSAAPVSPAPLPAPPLPPPSTPVPAPDPAPTPVPAPVPVPSPSPGPSCGMSPSDWCASPAGDACGAHRDTVSCRADPNCEGMPYHGESVVPCIADERCFASNCPTVGCVTRCEALGAACATLGAGRCQVDPQGACLRSPPCGPPPSR